MLLSREFLNQLEYLNLVVRRVLAGERKAEHFSLQKGGSVEFEEHRAYTPGDDLRYLDWNVYARHGELFVKEFAAEEDAHVVLLLDGSRSMDFGEPNRFQFGKKLCAALAYITLAQFDTCSVILIRDRLQYVLRRVRGTRQIYRLLERLDDLSGDAVKPFDRVQSLPSLRSSKNSTAVLISDFYDREALRPFLRNIRAIHLDLYGLHVLTPQEIEPEFRGGTRLVDRETGEGIRLNVDDQTLEQYRTALNEHLQTARSLALRYGGGYARLMSETPLVPGVVQLLQKHQILQ